MQPIKEELEQMDKLGVIEQVTEPTTWMAVVPKTNGKVRICVDLTKLNASMKRERQPL